VQEDVGGQDISAQGQEQVGREGEHMPQVVKSTESGQGEKEKKNQDAERGTLVFPGQAEALQDGDEGGGIVDHAQGIGVRDAQEKQEGGREQSGAGEQLPGPFPAESGRDHEARRSQRTQESYDE